MDMFRRGALFQARARSPRRHGMIFGAAAVVLLGLGGLTAWIAHARGRSAVLWGIYGALLAPLALPHLLRLPHLDPEDGLFDDGDSLSSEGVGLPAGGAKLPNKGRSPVSGREFDDLRSEEHPSELQSL